MHANPLGTLKTRKLPVASDGPQRVPSDRLSDPTDAIGLSGMLWSNQDLHQLGSVLLATY